MQKIPCCDPSASGSLNESILAIGISNGSAISELGLAMPEAIAPAGDSGRSEVAAALGQSGAAGSGNRTFVVAYRAANPIRLGHSATDQAILQAVTQEPDTPTTSRL